jgi:hypothetical protein
MHGGHLPQMKIATGGNAGQAHRLPLRAIL